MPLPSPKFHDQMLLQPGVDMFVEVLVVSNWVTFLVPVIGLTVKPETGAGHTVFAWTWCVIVLDTIEAFVTVSETFFVPAEV